MKRWIMYIVFLAGLLASCSNEIDLIKSGGPVPVVYCLLNPQSDVQFVRLSKTYIIDSTLVGKVPPNDSTKWDVAVEIYLEEYNELDDTEEVYYFEETINPPKDSGYFPDENFALYKADLKPVPNVKYVLYVHFPEQNRIASGKTIVMSLPVVIDPMNVMNRTVTFDSLASLFIRWMPALNGGLYQGFFRFHFSEIEGDNTNNQFVDFPTPIYSELMSTGILEQQLNPQNFYRFLSENLQPNPDIRRIPIGLEYLFYSTGSDLGLWYNTLNDGTSSQTTLYEYSNMEGGVGIFSSWVTQRIPNLKLSKVSLRNLTTHPLTKNLGFE